MEEIKHTTREEIGAEDSTVKSEGKIAKAIAKLSEIMEKMKKDRHQKAWLNTPEGKKWQAQMKEIEEINKRAAKQDEIFYAVKLREAKRKIALSVFADELISKYGIKDDDPRLGVAMREVDILRHLNIDSIE